ncbi:MAG TPA: hypothetical protein VER33_10865 [Polyangiaceae bacterium]|nr:hypothetical protein [Polyangiaceae bacterium]
MLVALAGVGLPAVAASAGDVLPVPRRPSRLLPPLQGSDVATLGVERDGTRRFAAYGLRFLAFPDGAVSVSDEFFPLSRNVQALELPLRFGSGFVFWVISSGRTSLWKATSWTARLEPLAELDFELDRLVPGFDRLYVQARRSGEWGALDARTGAGLDAGSLPAGPNFGAMAFVDEWFGAVELPVRGTVVSFDAGASWHPVGLTAMTLAPLGSELLLLTAAGRRVLAADGSLRSLDPVSAEAAPADELRRVPAEGPLGRLPLREAVLRGALESTDAAVVAVNGAIGRVRLSDGRVHAVRRRVLPEGSDCHAVRLGQAHGFVCGEERGGTTVYALEPSLQLRRVESFTSPRAVTPSGNGALVIRGGCASDDRSGRRVHCIRTPTGARFEVPVLGDAGVERVIALGDGRAAVLVPPRLGTAGSLILVDATGRRTNTALRQQVRDTKARALLAQGFWLDGMVQSGDGSLSGWVAGHGVFTGVRVTLQGEVRSGPLQRSIDRALLAGERALVVPAAGIAEQSIDGGFSWTDVDLPADIELDPARAAASPGRLEQGCSAVGCGFLGWLRVGWDGPKGGKSLVVAAAPRPGSMPSPGGGRWILRCWPTGDVSRPSAVPTTAIQRAAGAEAKVAWSPLGERPAPAVPPDSVGFDIGNEGQLRAYTWTPRGVDFGKAGRVAVSVADRYDIPTGVWSTRPTPSPWPDAVVADVFGAEASVTPAWRLALDSSGRSGVLSVTARSTTDLVAVEEGRALEPLVNATREGIGALTSAVRLGSTYYVAGQEDARTLRLFALHPRRARLVGQYADVASGRSATPTLVRSTRGNALGLWARGAGWYVYPVNPETGAVDRALQVTARELSRVPRPCAPDEEGFLLEGGVSVEPYVELSGVAERASARAFEGRFVVNQHGICVRALVAQADGSAAPTAAQPKRAQNAAASVPLVVVDRAAGGRRWGFRCATGG